MTIRRLFKHGSFTAASGRALGFKIECDAFDGDQWADIAAICAERIPRFGSVMGVPRGGTPFAEQLTRFIDQGSTVTLVADDVWTTGGSMTSYLNRMRPDGPASGETFLGLVVFARQQPPPWVHSLFGMMMQEEAKHGV